MEPFGFGNRYCREILLPSYEGFRLSRPVLFERAIHVESFGPSGGLFSLITRTHRATRVDQFNGFNECFGMR